MNDINHITLSGRVGTDLETKELGGDTTVTRWRFAVSRKDRNGEEHTTWVSCEVWNRAGVESWVFKGDLLFITGFLKINEYEKKDGSQGTEVVVSVRDIRKPPSGGDNARPDGDGPARPRTKRSASPPPKNPGLKL